VKRFNMNFFKVFSRLFCGFFVCFTLFACAEGDNYAPVTDIHGMEKLPATGMHRVAKDETLYSIAWRYGLDYRELAARNNIKPPYTIQQSQLIRISSGVSARASQPSQPPLSQPSQLSQHNMQRKVTQPLAQAQGLKSVSPAGKLAYDVGKDSAANNPAANNTPANNSSGKEYISKEPNYSVSGWAWPAQGKITHSFSVANKGINIAGQAGEPIYAATAGKIVYRGDGLRGYGNLIIIKHNSLYLSAYAHCQTILVKEGQWVRRGQVIAKMGNTGADQTMLHFEIRRAGKPINPLSLYKSIRSK
jgi:lipoprotein NlpD